MERRSRSTKLGKVFLIRKKGIVDTPIVLILCVSLGLLAIGLGEKTLIRLGEIKDTQTSIKEFDDFIEFATETCYSELEIERKIALNLNGYKISIDGKIAQLRKEKETIRSEKLPIPLVFAENEKSTIEKGNFLLKLTKSSKGNHSDSKLILKLSRG